MLRLVVAAFLLGKFTENVQTSGGTTCKDGPCCVYGDWQGLLGSRVFCRMPCRLSKVPAEGERRLLQLADCAYATTRKTLSQIVAQPWEATHTPARQLVEGHVARQRLRGGLVLQVPLGY